jgi:hypothetical protein
VAKKSATGPVFRPKQTERPEIGAGPGSFKSQDGYATAYRTLNPNSDAMKVLIAKPALVPGGGQTSKGAISAPKTPGSYGKND